MKPFSCERCGARVFFENVSCGACESQLGFVVDELTLGSFTPCGKGLQRVSGKPSTGLRRCANHDGPIGCNWMVSADGREPLCLCCRSTRILPALTKPANRSYWYRIEAAKRQLVYSLVSWRLPFPSKKDDPNHGVAFEFLEQVDPSKKVLTGHSDGVITLNIAEADDSRREQLRAQMQEPYRTLLGHLRHEIGHYYWDRLVRNTRWIPRFRQLFGDERQDYASALRKHYATPLPGWSSQFVSAYASSHPWEDWAECWAHYMHLHDGMETAAAWGLKLEHAVPGSDAVTARAIDADDAQLQIPVIKTWLPISQFINAMARSLGAHDSYPFVVPNPVLDKLTFIHQVIASGVRGDTPMNFGPPVAAKTAAGPAERDRP